MRCQLMHVRTSNTANSWRHRKKGRQDAGRLGASEITRSAPLASHGSEHIAKPAEVPTLNAAAAPARKLPAALSQASRNPRVCHAHAIPSHRNPSHPTPPRIAPFHPILFRHRSRLGIAHGVRGNQHLAPCHQTVPGRSDFSISISTFQSSLT